MFGHAETQREFRHKASAAPRQNPGEIFLGGTAAVENANRRQHTADERASSRKRPRKQQKLVLLAVAGALRDERHHPPKVAHGLGLVLVI